MEVAIGKSILKTNCAICGKEIISDTPGRIYCSHECVGKRLSEINKKDYDPEEVYEYHVNNPTASLRAIGKVYGISYEMVRNILRSHDINGGCRKERRRVINEKFKRINEQFSERLDRIIEEGKEIVSYRDVVKEVVEKYGCDYSFSYVITRITDANRERADAYIKGSGFVLADRIEKELLESDLMFTEIAEKYNTKQNYVYGINKRRGVRTITKRDNIHGKWEWVTYDGKVHSRTLVTH